MLRAGALGAYAALPDRNTGDLVTESDWQIIVDNFEFLHKPPMARAYHDANQSIADSTWTALSFNQERYDNDGIHDTVTNNSRLTCQTAGVYVMGGSVEWAGVNNGDRKIRITLNGTTDIALRHDDRDGGSNTAQEITAIPYKLAVGDYVELFVQQTSGGALNVLATGNFSPEFGMVWIGIDA